MLDPTPSSSSSSSAVAYTNLSIDDSDILMKDLLDFAQIYNSMKIKIYFRQKLIKTHHQEQNGTVEHQSGYSRYRDNGSLHLRPHELTFLSTRDNRYSSLKSTIVDGKALGCFIIGGECRLCFPQMRALCLGDISTQKIDEAMKLLAIVNPLANEEQLTALKRAGLAHLTLSKCELITKTNAERLISLLNSAGTSPIDDIQRAQLRSLRVVHDCFGGCSALLFPELAPHACFECCTCHRMFNPEDFCRHTHQTPDVNETFWGFDVSNWPYYIRVDDEVVTADEEAEQQLIAFVQSYTNNPI